MQAKTNMEVWHISMAKKGIKAAASFLAGTTQFTTAAVDVAVLVVERATKEIGCRVSCCFLFASVLAKLKPKAITVLAVSHCAN